MHRKAFSCGFCEISKKNFFTEHLWATASKWVWNLGTIAPGKWNVSKVAIQLFAIQEVPVQDYIFLFLM